MRTVIISAVLLSLYGGLVFHLAMDRDSATLPALSSPCPEAAPLAPPAPIEPCPEPPACWLYATPFTPTNARDCVIFKEVTGGLGNQLFLVSAAVVRAQQTGRVLSFSTQGDADGMVRSPVYWQSFFRFLSNVPERLCTPVSAHYGTNQFEGLPTALPARGSVLVEGLAMNLSEAHEHRHLLYGAYVDHTYGDFRLRYPGRNLVIGFRSYEEERQADWSSSEDYYKRAIATVLRADHTVHVFGDGGVRFERFVRWVRGRVERPVVAWPGSRDVNGTVMHLQYMVRADDFVLCSSAYHLWGALLTQTHDAVVVMDATPGLVGSDRNWLELAHAPPHWRRITTTRRA